MTKLDKAQEAYMKRITKSRGKTPIHIHMSDEVKAKRKEQSCGESFRHEGRNENWLKNWKFKNFKNG